MVDGYSVKRTREQVREQTRKEERNELAKEMLLDGKPMNEIMKYSELTEEKIREFEKTLR
jgi:hypothetical protein